MPKINNNDLDWGVYRAIISIESTAIHPSVSTIRTLLIGNRNSSNYAIFKDYKDLCGLYDELSDKEIERSIERLLGKGFINCTQTSKGKFHYSVKAVILNNRTSKETFYDVLNENQRYAVDSITNCMRSLLPSIEVKDSTTSRRFLMPNDENGSKREICKIEKYKSNSRLKLAYLSGLEANAARKKYKFLTQPTINKAIERLNQAFKLSDVEKTKIKILRKDHFDEFKSNTAKLIELMPHQKAGVELADKYDRFAFFYDTGTGKTIMSLEIMMRKQIQNNARFIVVAPKPLIKSAWMDDSKQFPKMKLLPLSKNVTRQDYAQIFDYWETMEGRKKRYTDEDGYILDGTPSREVLRENLIKRAGHFIINIEQIRESKKGEKLLKETNANGLIIDESVIIKNYETEAARRMRVFAKNMRYVYLLSGNPAPNGSIEYFSQMKIVDPETFSMSFSDFAKEFYTRKHFKYGDDKFSDKSLKSKNAIAKMVANRSITIKKEDCLILPEAFHQRRTVAMTSETRRFYKDVLDQVIAEIKTKDGKTLVEEKIMMKAPQLTKLREIASGFYIKDGQNYAISQEKIDALKELLDEIGKGNKIIIWCNFRFEIKCIEKELKKCGYNVVTAYSETSNELDNNIESFKHGSAEIMIANPLTLKYGVTFTDCNYCIFNSMSYSLDDYCQAHDRIYRKGQTKPCYYYFLITDDTIDEIIYKCVSEKKNKSKMFEMLIKSASKFKI